MKRKSRRGHFSILPIGFLQYSSYSILPIITIPSSDISLHIIFSEKILTVFLPSGTVSDCQISLMQIRDFTLYQVLLNFQNENNQNPQTNQRGQRHLMFLPEPSFPPASDILIYTFEPRILGMGYMRGLYLSYEISPLYTFRDMYILWESVIHRPLEFRFVC